MSGISRITNGMISLIIHNIIYPLSLILTDRRPSLTLSIPSRKELEVNKSEVSLSVPLTDNKPTLSLTVKRKKILTITICKKE